MSAAELSEIVAIIEQHLVVLRRKAIHVEGAGFGECVRGYDRSEPAVWHADVPEIHVRG